MFRITPYTSNSPRKDGFRDAFDLFDEFFNDKKYHSNSFKIDVKEFEKEYVIYAELPGLKKEDIQIHYENERLSISVNKNENIEETKDNYIHRERYSSNYERSIYIKDINPKNLKAKLNDGILEITAEKSEDAVNKYLVDIE
ncbi:MAG: Hsp20 family protein [Bacilli bacterium]|nr:Hsp20 family protein [Bacilli bacterium]